MGCRLAGVWPLMCRRATVRLQGRGWTSFAADGIEHNKNSCSKLGWKWIHVVPVIVVFCFFILCYLFYPVDLKIKDGRIAAIHPWKMPKSMNDTHVDLTILATFTPPIVAVTEINPSNVSCLVTRSTN